MRALLRPLARASVVVAVSAAAVGCATTVEETTDAIKPEATTAPVSTAPTATGEVDDPLAALASEMSGLGSLVAAGGPDDDEALARIETLWSAVQAGLEADQPDLVDEFTVVIDMVRTSVARRRPADADKAYGLLLDLVDRIAG